MTTSPARYPESTIINITLNSVDVNNLKATRDLAKFPNNTYITYLSDLTEDLEGNSAIPRVDGVNTTRAAYVTRDNVPSELVSFTAQDFNEGFLELSFSEPVDPDTFIPSLFVLNSASDGTGTTYNFTGGIASLSMADVETVRIFLSSDDILALQRDSTIATSVSNTFIVLQTGAISDFSDNLSPPSTTPIRVTSYQDDVTSAMLTAYTVDKNSSALILTFGDPVLVSSLNPSSITLQGDADGIDIENSYTLTGGTSPSSDGQEIVLQLAPQDVEQLQLRSGLATSAENTYLTMLASVVMDDRGLGVIPISTGLQVTTFIPDRIVPVLLNFTLNLTTGEMVLYFSEIMDPTSYNPQQFIIQSTANATQENSSQCILTSGQSSKGSVNNVIVISLPEADLNGIRMQRILVSSIDTVYLALLAGAITDTGNNSVVVIPTTDAIELPHLN